jgi:hypothetical protein
MGFRNPASRAERRTLDYEPLLFRSVQQKADIADCHCWYLQGIRQDAERGSDWR